MNNPTKVPWAALYEAIAVASAGERTNTAMITQDDRTPEQKETHCWAVVMRDTFLSGWGGAKGGASRAAWAVNPDEVNPRTVEAWVRGRGDAKNVRLVNLRFYRVPRGTAHFHIYVVHPNHPAAQ